MLRYLRQLSAFAFYVLGTTFFVAYVLLRNSLLGTWPALWMQVADMPLALSAILYGGISFYLTLRPRKRVSAGILATIVALPLTAFFLLLVVLKFGYA